MTDLPIRDPDRDRLLGAAFGQPGDAGPDCLDAEVIAAWVEGGLPEDARARAETHAADCARCQALLAVIARMNESGVSDGAGRAAEPAVTATAVPMPTLRRWLIPLAAAAGVVLTVLLLPDRNPTLPEPVADEARTESDAARSAPPPASPIEPGTRLARQAPAQERALLDKVAAPVVIPTPDPAVSYRVTGVTVEKSIDSGATWRTTPTGLAAPVVAGSAPSATTCWLVGPAGLVVLTTDGGSWRRLDFPEPVDLTSVTATSAQQATVTAADGRVFSTEDGGRTWLRREVVQED